MELLYHFIPSQAGREQCNKIFGERERHGEMKGGRGSTFA
jgi:hypothetical protein